MISSKSSSAQMGDALERALRHWEGKARPEGEAALPAAPARRPCSIAVSRQSGTNGTSIARTVGQRLGWPVYDHELVQQIAQEMGLRASLLESVDEKQVSWLRESVEVFANMPTVTLGAYLRHLVEVLLSLAAHGNCIVVGRGAAHILPRETTLRVRLVAPREDRIAVLRQRYRLSPEEAARRIEVVDEERRRFVREHFRQDPDEPENYDLVLNASRYTTRECAELIEEALRRLESHAVSNQAEPAAGRVASPLSARLP